tara:strand:- start:468 stop:677 length:210 start_codon:yes stop_codon:yes gene_type:complete
LTKRKEESHKTTAMETTTVRLKRPPISGMSYNHSKIVMTTESLLGAMRSVVTQLLFVTTAKRIDIVKTR